MPASLRTSARPLRRRARAAAAGATALAVLLGGGLTTSAYAGQGATDGAGDLAVADIAAEPLARGLIVKTRSAGVSVRGLAAATSAALTAGQSVAAGAGPIAADITIGPAIEGTTRLLAFEEPLPSSTAEAVAAVLEDRIDVEWAVPDLPRRAMADPVIPNDPQFLQQWDMWDSSRPQGGYSIKAPLIWGTTVGSSDVVVAVVDTGITNHPDLAGQLVAGYDFVSDAAMGNDGDGRDPDPADPGDWVSQSDVDSGRFGSYCDAEWIANSTWHGTHVAGTIAAIQDNSYGISGIAPGVKLQAVRALGKCGGYDFDIAAAMTWAVGGSVSGVPVNATPASVVNLSLGGEGTCLRSYRDAIDFATSAGAVVVVAAGNESSPLADFAPGNCPGVVSVTSTSRAGSLASYSNYGTAAAQPTIAAPGGDYGVDGGVYSTMNSGTTVPRNPVFTSYQGTSMATPHVAGAAALVYSLGVSGTQRVIDELTASVQAFPASSGCTVVRCGAGILDLSRLAATAPPGAPSDLVHEQIDSRSLRLSWTPPNTGSPPTGYAVQASINGADWIDDATTVDPEVTLTLSAGVAYRFRVAAMSDVGTGAWSLPTDVIELRAVSEPGAPTAVRVQPGDGAVTVSWQAPTNDGGAPLAEYVVTAEPGRHLCSTTELTCVVEGLANGVVYSVSVTASNAAGLTSRATATVSAAPRATPGAVRSVTVTYRGSGTIKTATIRWRAPSDDGGAPVVRYRARIARAGAAYGAWTYTTMRAVQADVRKGRVYRVQISARNAAGYGATVTVRLMP